MEKPQTQPQGQPQPGQQRGPQQQRRRNRSRYAQQLEEKQNLKELFGIRERNLRRYYTEAREAEEETGPALISLLERRLDNAIYRAGFAGTRSQARQFATHGLFTVNGKPVDVPSYRLRVDDAVKVKETKTGKAVFKNLSKQLESVDTPSWLVVDPKNLEIKIKSLPNHEEAGLGVDTWSVIEFLAR